jgi:hypothetical protein
MKGQSYLMKGQSYLMKGQSLAELCQVIAG